MGTTGYTQSLTSTLGGRLEHDRLAVRAVRLRSILTALRDQPARHSVDARALARARNAAILGFEAELAEIRDRLEQIG